VVIVQGRHALPVETVKGHNVLGQATAQDLSAIMEVTVKGQSAIAGVRVGGCFAITAVVVLAPFAIMAVDVDHWDAHQGIVWALNVQLLEMIMTTMVTMVRKREIINSICANQELCRFHGFQ